MTVAMTIATTMVITMDIAMGIAMGMIASIVIIPTRTVTTDSALGTIAIATDPTGADNHRTVIRSVYEEK